VNLPAPFPTEGAPSFHGFGKGGIPQLNG